MAERASRHIIFLPTFPLSLFYLSYIIDHPIFGDFKVVFDLAHIQDLLTDDSGENAHIVITSHLEKRVALIDKLTRDGASLRLHRLVTHSIAS